jgi:hypothetical protein
VPKSKPIKYDSMKNRYAQIKKGAKNSSFLQK